MGSSGNHAVGKILRIVEESSPLPLGWACLVAASDDSDRVDHVGLVLAHIAFDDEAKPVCDRSIVLKPLDAVNSESLAHVTFNDFSSSETRCNSTSLVINDIRDLALLFKENVVPPLEAKRDAEDEENRPNKFAKKSEGDEGTVASLDRKAELEELVDSLPQSDDVESTVDDTISSLEPVTLGSANDSFPLPSQFSFPSLPTAPTLLNSASSPAFRYSADKERPYKCPECGKTFRRGNHLKDHVRLHVGETYQCPVCQFECILQTKFTHHLTSHNNTGPFACEVCSKSFDRAHDLARHLPLDHGVDSGFRLSHFRNSFSAIKFKDKKTPPPAPSRPPSFIPPAPPFSAPSFSASFLPGPPPFPRPFTRPKPFARLAPPFPLALSSLHAAPLFSSIPSTLDSGTGSPASVPNSDENLYGDRKQLGAEDFEADEPFARVKSLADSFDDDILIE